LRVLVCRAAGQLVEPLAGVTRIDAAEFGEGTEEMIVPGHALSRDEAPHREGVNQSVVEAQILIDVGGRDIALPAYRSPIADRLRLGEGMGRFIDAQPVFDCVADQRLSKDGAVQMIVKLCALWACA